MLFGESFIASNNASFTAVNSAMLLVPSPINVAFSLTISPSLVIIYPNPHGPGFDNAEPSVYIS